MHWLNEPPVCQRSERQIQVRTAPDTDFWRITHYDFIRDTGHFYHEAIATDFCATVTFHGQYTDQYDQAGLMVRLDANHWIKTGIEYVDGQQNLSAVVTREFSDWSVVPLATPPTTVTLQLERRQTAIHLRYALDGASAYTLLRLAYFPAPPTPLQVGIMCASPQGQGFAVVFEDYQVQPLTAIG